jgi:uncharacterized protein YegL
MAIRPGGEYAGRPLHFIWLLDCSGSMTEGGKIEALNNALREVIPAIRKATEGNPEVQFFMRALKFSTGAEWHVETPTPAAEFKWMDVRAGGETDMGQAFALLAAELQSLPQTARLLPPVVVLVSDGKPTDDWRGALQALLEVPWAKRAVKMAIAIGQDADQETLRKFMDDPERPVLRADNAEQLVNCIKWVSTSITATPPGRELPKPPPVERAAVRDDSVW